MNATPTKKKNDGRFVLLCFLGFFGVVGTVDFIFVTTALRTHTGVITDKAYERGLDFNKTLSQADYQKSLGFQDVISYENGNLKWNLQDAHGVTIKGLKVKATLIRPVQKGYDFELTLNETQDGSYSAPVQAPLKGRWIAEVETQWNNQPYKDSQEIITP